MNINAKTNCFDFLNIHFKIEFHFDKTMSSCISKIKSFYKDFFFDFFLNVNEADLTTQDNGLRFE